MRTAAGESPRTAAEAAARTAGEEREPDRVAEAGLPSNCTAHGLRKIGAVRSAENGATAKQMMALFGWDSVRMAEHYTKMAEQKKLTAASVHTLIA